MFEKARLLNLLVCAVFGLAGGAASHLLLNARAVSAQQTSNLIRTRRLELLDGDKVVAVFGRDPKRPQAAPELVLRSGMQEVRLNADGLKMYYDDYDSPRMVVGYYNYPMEGGARGLGYLLGLYDRMGNTKHELR